LTQTLTDHGALTGQAFSNGSTSASFCTVGDGANNIVLRGLMSFEKSQMATGATNIDLGQLNVTATRLNGTPFVSLVNHVNIYRVSFTSLSGGYNVTGTTSGTLPSVSSVPTSQTANVLAGVNAALADSASNDIQFRLQFNQSTDGDGLADYVRYATNPTLKIRYYAP
jgi:hypothetical protein